MESAFGRAETTFFQSAKYFWLVLFPLRLGGARLGLMPR
jgi:hypothetical protein